MPIYMNYNDLSLLPADTRQVVTNLHKAYGKRLVVAAAADGSVRPEWLQIRVFGLTEQQLLHDLERKSHEIFGGKLDDFYVINYLDGKDVRNHPGVWLYHLKPEEKGIHPSGFWYA